MHRKNKIIVIITILVFASIGVVYFLSRSKPKESNGSHFYNIKSAWVDSLLKNMSIEEKLGNLIIFDASNINNKKLQLLDVLVFKYHIGGLVLKQDSINSYINIINRYQSKLKIPLLIILKQENSFPKFFNDGYKLPNQLTIDAVTNDSLRKKLSKFYIKTYKNLGINFSFIPQHKKMSDRILNNDLNIIKKFNNDSVLSCFKILDYKDKFVNSIIKSDISSVFLTNDTRYDTLNKYFISDYLRDTLNFKGLILSRYRNLSQIKNFINSSSDLIFINKDIDKTISFLKQMYAKDLLSVDNINKRVIRILKAKVWTGNTHFKKINSDNTKKILNSVEIKQLNRKIIEESVTLVKNYNNKIPVKNINQKIFIYNIGNDFLFFKNQVKFYQTNYNYKNLKKDTFLIKRIKFYNDYSHFIFNIDINNNDTAIIKILKSIINKNTDKNITIVNYKNINLLTDFTNAKKIIQVYNNTKAEQELAAQLIFGGIHSSGILPYIPKKLKNYKPLKTKKTRLGYTIPEEFLINSKFADKIDSIVYDAIARHAFPGCQIFVAKQGKVIFNKSYGYHSYARQVKVKWDDLYDIASITKIAATTLATMKMLEQGKLNINKNIGKYFKNTHIEYTRIKTDTTIRVDTVNILKLSKKKIKKMVNNKDTIHLTDSTIVIYDTVYWKVTPKLNIFKRTVKQMLMHRSGLPPSMPILRYIMYAKDTNITLPDSFKVDYGKYIYFDTLKNFNDTVLYTFNKYFTRKYIKDTATLQIARNLYLRKTYEDTLWIDTKQIKVYSKEVFMYSDVNPIIVQRTIDTINNYSIDKYLKNRFYNSLGCRTIGYLPLKHFKRNKIIPTEFDKYWRGQVLQGYVHDPSAALMGGIAGNAGLFTNATDLGIIFQMLLNGGVYGGKRYLSNSTINKFTSYQEGTFRGIGFDKGTKKNIIAPSASPNSYGHTGFTGTCVWVDPDNKLVYVFLSNRVHPSAKNWQINTLKIRQKIHQAVYDAIKKNN